jgi:Tol biopolymer transport system component
MRSLALLAVAFVASVLPGCVTKGFRYAGMPVDPAWELLYVKDRYELHIDPRHGAESHPLFQSTARLLLPRCSPDRERVAFYTFVGRRGELNVMDMNAGSSGSAAHVTNTLAEIEGPMGQRMALFPPIWESDGNSLLVVDESGIHRIAVDRTHELLVAKDDILGVSISPDGSRIAYADGMRIHIVDAGGNAISAVKTTSPSNRKKQDVQPLAFSPDGSRIAYAAGRNLDILSLGGKESREVLKSREILDMRDAIFWIQWLPGSDRLVFTTGKSVRRIRTSTTAAPYGTAQGYYELYTIGADGSGLKILYENREMDAHFAQPAISHDGRHVAIISGKEANRRVMVVATDGTGSAPLTAAGISAHPSWLPPLDTPGSRGGGPVVEGPCRSVAVYPLD